MLTDVQLFISILMNYLRSNQKFILRSFCRFNLQHANIHAHKNAELKWKNVGLKCGGQLD